MPEVVVRKKLTSVEEIFHEGGPVAEKPICRAAALAVIRNPFAGSYVASIEGFDHDQCEPVRVAYGLGPCGTHRPGHGFRIVSGVGLLLLG